MIIRRCILSTLCLLLSVSLCQAQRKDSTLIQEVHDSIKAQVKAPIIQVPVTLKSLVIPGALFAYGCITLNNTRLGEINEEVKEVVWDNRPHKQLFIEDFTLLVPAATVYVLNFAGYKGRNNFVDRSIIYGMSNLIANGIGFGVKRLGIEMRPDSSSKHSFPSGHTAEAFVSAEFIRQEYRGKSPWLGIAGYAMAIGTGYMRMYNNKHWLSDVVGGAGIGIASTRFAYYLYPAIKHWIFGSRKIKGNGFIAPTYNNGVYGLVAMYQLP